MVGRLTHPMAYDAATDRYLPVSWEEAFATIGRHLRALPDPNMAEFYTSGRTSNEAAFLYQLFVREYGTNNFPDCSNMCHEATSVGLPQSLGVGKGTVLLDDFDKTDCIFIFGQNPGTNSPRMMTSLRNASRRGATIISFNPFRERALERFQAPQNPVEMISLTSTPISSRLHQVRVGGDVAVLKGLMKVLVEEDERARAEDQIEILDWDFIRGHTVGIDACEGTSVIPTVRSPCTLEWPRTGHRPAPSLPTLPFRRHRLASCWILWAPCLCCVRPMPKTTMARAPPACRREPSPRWRRG